MPDWDGKYANAPDGLFGLEPNEYVRQVHGRSDFSAKTALCLADGDGRNGRWLATQGLDVTAVDLSVVGTQNAKQFDADAGVSVERICCEITQWRTDGRIWDSVFLIYLQSPWAERRAALDAGWSALASGGLFAVEAFAKWDGRQRGMGPDDDDLRYSVGEILGRLKGCRPIEAMAGSIWLEEGSRHTGEAHVVRVLARKP